MLLLGSLSTPGEDASILLERFDTESKNAEGRTATPWGLRLDCTRATGTTGWGGVASMEDVHNDGAAAKAILGHRCLTCVP